MTPKRPKPQPANQAARELAELRARLAEAQATLEAIRSGAVDALIVSGDQGDQVFALKSAETPYRLLVEAMHDAALMLDPRGTILYCNHGFAALAQYSTDGALGQPFADFVLPEHFTQLARLLTDVPAEGRTGELCLRSRSASASPVPVQLSVRPLVSDGFQGLVAVATDLTTQKAYEAILHRSNQDLEQRVRSRTVELQAHREWFRVTLSSIGDAVIAFDTSGHVTFLNPVAVRLTGWSEAEALGQPASQVLRIIHEQTRLPVEDLVARVLREKHAIELANHTALLTRDGRELPVEDSAAPILDAAGQSTGVVVVFHEVTEKRRAQEALRESEARLRMLSDRAPVLLGHWDLDHRFKFANLPYAARFGLTPDQIIGKHLRELVGEHAYTVIRPWLEKGLRGEVSEFELEIPFEKLGTQWLHAAYTRQLDADGRVVGILGAFQDITARKQGEQALRQSKERFELSMEATNDGLWDWNTETDEIYYSPSYYRMLGFEPGGFPATPQTWRALVHPDDLSRLMQITRDCVAGSTESFACEYRMKTRDGEWRWILGRGKSTTRNCCGRAVRLIGTHVDITEFKRAQDALRSQAALLDLAHDAIIVRGPGDAISFWNQGAEATYGWTRAEAMGRVTHELLRTRFPKPLPELMAEVATHGQWEGELIHTRKDGQTITTASRWAAQRDEAGRPAGVLEINRDVTARQLADAALRESEQRLALALEGGHMGMWQWDLRTNHSVWNVKEYELLGLPPGDSPVPTHLFFQHLHPDDISELERSLQEAFSKRQDWRHEFRIIRPDGLVRWLAGAGRASVDERGQPQKMVGVNYDITERKQAEEALACLAAIVEHSDDAIISKAPDGTIRTWNAGAARMFGYQAHEAIGRPITFLIPPERLEEEDRIMARLRQGKPVEHFETVRLAKDGRRLDVSLTISPIKDSHGRITGASKIVRDIGDLVRAREVLARNKVELECLVTERTAQLQELVTELEHFSYSITHDMRAPLRAMTGFLKMAAELCGSAEVEEQKRLLLRISQAAARMDVLIRDALNYNEAIRKHLPLAPIDPNLLLRGMLDTYPEFHGPNVRIQVQPDMPRVIANEAGLIQAFSNLLHNAIKFAKPGQPAQVHIWAEPTQRPSVSRPDPALSPQPIPSAGFTPIPSLPSSFPSDPNDTSWVRFWVEDQGIGISAQFLPRVFNMFSRGSHEQAGTGIGLALVRKVADRMGGRVGAESTEGQGSRFWLELLRAGRG